MNRLPRAVLAVALVLTGASHAGRAAPAAARPMLDAVLAAANASKPDVAARHTTTGRRDVLSWVRERSLLGTMMGEGAWKLAVLDPPYTPGPESVAVFHRWHTSEADNDHIHPIVRTPSGFRLGPELPETQTHGFRIRHHNLDVTIDPVQRTAAIRDDVDLDREAGAQRVVLLRLSNDFTVSGIQAGKRDVAFRQAGGVVAVRPPAGRTARLRMTYKGRVVHRHFSSIENNFALLNAYYWPSLGRLPATSETRIVAPRGWTAITQGELVRQADTGAVSEWRWKNVLPVNYLSIAAGKYHKRVRETGGRKFYTYLLNDNAAFSDTLLDALELAMPYFEGRFGAFPYTRYSIVDGGSVMGFAALEGYSFATYGTLTLSPFVVAHELSHTWWGGMVANTYLGSWWNEAFASYSDDAFSRMRNKVAPRHPTDRPWWPSHAQVDGASLAAARHDDNVGVIAYQKGMVVLRLLEDEIGTDRFNAALRHFVAAQKGRPDPGWPDFRRSLESTTGQDWGWFFGQWMQRAGWPAPRLADVRVAPMEGGRFRLSGRIVQPNPAYRLRIPVRVETVGETVTEFVAVGPGQGSGAFSITTTSAPRRLALDPEFNVPRRFSVDDVAVFDDTGRARLEHSREEAKPSGLGL